MFSSHTECHATMMSIARSIIYLFVATFAAWPVFAAVEEIDQRGLRQAVAVSRALPFASIIEDVLERMDGDLIEVRAFEDDRVYYRVLVLNRNGQVVSAVLDAASGRFLSIESQKAKAIQLVARGVQSQASVGGGLDPNALELPQATQTTPASIPEQATSGEEHADDKSEPARSGNSGARSGGGQANRP